MTYLKPVKWYMYPFRFMARCQSKTIKEQYSKYNARMFDLRVYFKDGVPRFRHGLITYKGDVFNVLNYLNSKKDVEVRMILEDTKADLYQEEAFKSFCAFIVKNYDSIKFFGGRRKSDWKVIYDFNYYPTYLDKYSSVNNETTNYTGTVLDDWFPWIYAKFHNKKNIKEGTTRKYLFIDFVNIQ